MWPEVRKCHQDTPPEDEGPILYYNRCLSSTAVVKDGRWAEPVAKAFLERLWLKEAEGKGGYKESH